MPGATGFHSVSPCKRDFMEEQLYAYTGRLLRVNLTQKRFAVEEIPRRTIEEYIGGRGFVIKYAYDEIRPGTDPLSPENKIIFAVGPLTGTRMPSSGRYVVGGLSPLTHAYIRSVSGGAFGARLKNAGYDVLIVEGSASDWTYLYITSEGVEFRDATPMLGLLTEETEAAIVSDIGNKKAKCCVIGPSGEKLVRHACIQSERRSAGRGGAGCILGAKKLKGIAIYGQEKQKLYREKEFNRLMADHVKTNIKGAHYSHFHPLGTTGGVELPYYLGIHPVQNFQKGVFEGIENLYPDAILASGYKVRDTGCWNCYMKCGSLFDVPEGPFQGSNYENPEYETMWAFGANCMNSDFTAILKANQICDDYGADTITTGNAVGFLAECLERGLIQRADINGVDLKWGDPEAIVEVARQIVDRESPAGEWVADGGVAHAAQVIGGGAAVFAIHAKGMELPAYDPRGAQAHGLGYATSPIGGSHQIGYSVQEIFGFPEVVDRFSAEDKGRHTIWSNRYIMIFDCAVSCGFANAFTESRLDFESCCHWLALATGMEAVFKNPEALNVIFDRIFNLERAFNLRMGFTAEDDTLPERMLAETIQDGASAGTIWHRRELIADYYRQRGWDLETGVPLRETLARLGLVHVADDLERELPKRDA